MARPAHLAGLWRVQAGAHDVGRLHLAAISKCEEEGLAVLA